MFFFRFDFGQYCRHFHGCNHDAFRCETRCAMCARHVSIRTHLPLDGNHRIHLFRRVNCCNYAIIKRVVLLLGHTSRSSLMTSYRQSSDPMIIQAPKIRVGAWFKSHSRAFQIISFESVNTAPYLLEVRATSSMTANSA